MKKIHIYILSALALIFVASAAVTVAPSAQALDCGILPQSICNDSTKTSTDIKKTGVWGVLDLVLTIMTAGVGILAVGGIIYGAVLYTTAGGSPDKVKKARTIFVNVAIGVIAFAAMWAILNWLIPGGAFNV